MDRWNLISHSDRITFRDSPEQGFYTITHKYFPILAVSPTLFFYIKFLVFFYFLWFLDFSLLLMWSWEKSFPTLLLLYLIEHVLCCTEFLSFMRYPLLIDYLVPALSPFCSKSLLCQYIQGYSPLFMYQTRISSFMLKSLIHLDLNFMHVDR